WRRRTTPPSLRRRVARSSRSSIAMTSPGGFGVVRPMAARAGFRAAASKQLPGATRSSGGAPSCPEERFHNSLTRSVDAVSALFACVESGGSDCSFFVAWASVEEVAIGAGRNTLDLPQRVVDQRGKELLARFGELIDRSWVPVARRHDTPGEASNEPPPTGAETPALERLTEGVLG